MEFPKFKNVNTNFSVHCTNMETPFRNEDTVFSNNARVLIGLLELIEQYAGV